MVDDIENKIANLRLRLSIKNRSFLNLVVLLESYMKWMETVTSGLCYMEDLIFLENNIVRF